VGSVARDHQHRTPTGPVPGLVDPATDRVGIREDPLERVASPTALRVSWMKWGEAATPVICANCSALRPNGSSAAIRVVRSWMSY